MGNGPYLHLFRGGRHMVSEDSEDPGGFAVVHRLDDSRDLADPASRQMAALLHELNNLHELLEVVALRRQQLVLTEERNYHRLQVRESPNYVSVHRGSVVVVSNVLVDPATVEEVQEGLERS